MHDSQWDTKKINFNNRVLFYLLDYLITHEKEVYLNIYFDLEVQYVVIRNLFYSKLHNYYFYF